MRLVDTPTNSDLSLFVETLRGLQIYDEIKAICLRHGVLSPKDLRGISREWHLSAARGDAMRLIEARFGWSSLAIGRLFGRSPDTVLHLLGRTKTAKERSARG